MQPHYFQPSLAPGLRRFLRRLRANTTGIPLTEAIRCHLRISIWSPLDRRAHCRLDPLHGATAGAQLAGHLQNPLPLASAALIAASFWGLILARPISWATLSH